MRVAMIGGGYVGLVSGACFAEFGHDVVVVERDLTKLSVLRSNDIPIYEPELGPVVRRNAASKRLVFTDDLATAVEHAEVVFIAVGTPTGRSGGHADLSAVYESAKSVAQAAKTPLVIVTKSTVPVGTGREVARILRQTRPDIAFEVASNPEFLREGNAIEDFMRPDRVVIGVDTRNLAGASRARAAMEQVYAPLLSKGTPFCFTSLESAELAKYASNAFLAMKVAFINEMADLCEESGADVSEVADSMGFDHRIGEKFLKAGPGFGGSCFPKDTRALAAIAREAGVPSRLVEATINANEYRKETITRKIAALNGGSVAGAVISILGLTFKPDTDDMREATSLTVMRDLLELGAKLRVFDPEGMEQAQAMVKGKIEFEASPLQAVSGSDIVVLLTEWDIFRKLKPSDIMKAMRGKLVLDMRGVWDAAAFREGGAVFHAVGRPRPAADLP